MVRPRMLLRFSPNQSNSGRRRLNRLLLKKPKPRKIMAANSVLSKTCFVGQRLQLAREFRDLTQKQLGEAVVASHALVSLCESGKRTDPATDLVEAFGTVLGFDADFFYEPTGEIFQEDECSFRHRRSTPERLKTRIRAHASLLGMVLERLRRHFKFPALNIPRIPA